MRNFEVTLTFKVLLINQFYTRNVTINRQKVLDVELDESHCPTPEDFCNAVINQQERPKVVRINIKEKNNENEYPLNWISENLGRIYLYNGIPLVLNKN
jgi:hypothetical protein